MIRARAERFIRDKQISDDRARHGMIRARAERFIRDKQISDDVEVPSGRVEMPRFNKIARPVILRLGLTSTST
jgi:hypothetical protein